MTQQLIAALNAIPLADMTLEDQQVFAEAVALLSAQAREIERLKEAHRKLSVEASRLVAYAEQITPWVRMTEEADALEAKLLNACREVRAALQTQAGGE